LYTAPMTAPSTGQVQITAKAAGKSASTYIYQLAAGPTITSVSPNPIPVGSDTLTVTGAGFQSGAFVWVGAVRYGSVFVNAQTLKVAIYQGPATSVVVSAQNTGSVMGNSIVVPVSGT